MSSNILTSLVINDQKLAIRGKVYASNVFPHDTEKFHEQYDTREEFDKSIDSFMHDFTLGATWIRDSANQYKWIYRIDTLIKSLNEYAEKHPQDEFKSDAMYVKWSSARIIEYILQHDLDTLKQLRHDFLYGKGDEPEHPTRKEYYLLYRAQENDRVGIVTKITSRYVHLQFFDPDDFHDVACNYYRAHILDPSRFKIVHI